MPYCNADLLRSASAATSSLPMVLTVFLLLFIEHNVNEAINFTTYQMEEEANGNCEL